MNEQELVKYIEEHIVCNSCKDINTRLKKNAKNRLWEFNCKNCGQKEHREN